MLSSKEIEILQFFGNDLLIRKDELKQMLRDKGYSDGLFMANRLAEMGYLKFVEAVGAPCYTITQEGLRILKSS